VLSDGTAGPKHGGAYSFQRASGWVQFKLSATGRPISTKLCYNGAGFLISRNEGSDKIEN